jgi:hypothetical protein
VSKPGALGLVFQLRGLECFDRRSVCSEFDGFLAGVFELGARVGGHEVAGFDPVESVLSE